MISKEARPSAQRNGRLRFEHDLFGKPVSTFPDHALNPSFGSDRRPARLLPDSAGIHIDFQTDGDFDDLRGLPGHFISSSWLDGRSLADAAQKIART
jgi:hypothetical protein